MKKRQGWLWGLLWLCVALFRVAIAEPLYYWQDDAGRPHYSESPPDKGQSYRQLKADDLPSIHITPPANTKLYPASKSTTNKSPGAYYQPRGDRNRHSQSQCRHYQRQLRRMERCVRENNCGLSNRELRHQHHHWNVMYHTYCDF